MRVKIFGIAVKIDFSFVMIIAVAVIANKNGMVMSAFVAVTVHELAHLIAMLFLGVKISSVKLSALGVSINCSQLIAWGKEIAVLAAGPCANLILCAMFYASRNVEISVANLVIGVFNLLPIAGLDGGRITELLLMRFVSQSTASRVGLIISLAAGFSLMTAGFYVVMGEHKNFSLILAAAMLVSATFIKLVNENKKINAVLK